MNGMNVPSDSEVKKKNDHESIEYAYGTDIAGRLRDNTNSALGDILLMVESAMPQGPQLDSLKQLIKQRIWRLADDNQHSMYRALNVQ